MITIDGLEIAALRGEKEIEMECIKEKLFKLNVTLKIDFKNGRKSSIFWKKKILIVKSNEMELIEKKSQNIFDSMSK